MSYNRKLSQTQANYFADLTFGVGAKHHISPSLIAAIIVCESSARPNVISTGGDYGLMQVGYKVHKVKILLNPRVNIFAGTRILAQYREDRTLKAALKRYSGGSKKNFKGVEKNSERRHLTMQYDRKIIITVGNNRRSVNWQPQTLMLSEFYEKLRILARSTEKMAEYLTLKKSEQDDRKDISRNRT